MSENGETVPKKHKVEGGTGEARPETNGTYNKYDVFAAVVINTILSITASALAASLTGAIFFSVLYSANFPYPEVAKVVVVILVAIYIFRSTWNFLTAPDINKSRSMALWVYIKKPWEKFKHWIRTIGDDA